MLMSAKEKKRAVEHGQSGSKLQGPEVSGHNLQRAWRYYMGIDCEGRKTMPDDEWEVQDYSHPDRV